jgi:hypothetical protein
MHVLEYHAIMAHVSMKIHHIDVNVNEVMKVQHVIDKSIHAQVLFVIMEVSVMYKEIMNQCVNVHMVIEERIAMKQMVRLLKIIWHEALFRMKRKKIICMLIFLRFSCLRIDACHNVNCNYGQCLINQHDGTPYCECLPGYEGVRCVDEMRMIDSCE